MKIVIPKAGSLLLAEPFMPDPNFKRTVIFLCEHNEEGSFGLVLNRPSMLRLNEAIDDVRGFDAKLHVGGPVENNTLHYLHTLGNLIEGAIEVAPGLWWGGNFESVRALIKNGRARKKDFRFFLGYSGWSEGQLAEEMEDNSWMIHQATPDHIFDTNPNDLWKEVLQEKGGEYAMMVNYPEDPRLN